MTEITTATVASAAERIAATSYLWGQTSTGPIVDRRYAVTDFLTKDGSGNVGLGEAAVSHFSVTDSIAITGPAGGQYLLMGNRDGLGASKPAIIGASNGEFFFGFGNSWASATGGTLSTQFKMDSSGNLTLVNATGALGYGTGAGGAVTQATSRTTGVTLNKPCGSITLVSAAGSTSWQSFTVTNSLVAATDTIIVNQKSGTDKNMIHVTAVAAGSFVITFATTGGTTTEQPVFNFAIVRGVAA